MQDEDPSSTATERRQATGPRRHRSRLVWALLSTVVLAVGLAGTAVAIDHENDANLERDELLFAEDAAEVASLLRAELQRQGEFVISASAFAALEPEMTSEDMAWWVESVRAHERYPNLLALEFLRVAPTAGGPVRCYVQAVGYEARTRSAPPPSVDLCADPAIRRATLVAGESGDATFHGTLGDGRGPVRIAMPVYDGGAVPDSPEQRRAGHIGEVSVLLDAQTLLDEVLAGHGEMSGVVHFEDEVSRVTIESGSVSDPMHATEIPLTDGWTVSLVAGPGMAVTDALSSRTIALVGSAIAALLAALVYVLGTGRARALDLVDAATEELRHLALHDSLTGLPNRALIADRLDALIARGERNATTPAVLFVDLDGFKEINDTLGHAAGDDLLRSVASRLTDTLRDTDTIGRMGGDEFIVLVDGNRTDQAPEVVADRLLDALRPPFDTDHGPDPLSVTASVGIALGVRDEAGDLLRDADVALYEAKAAGRDCWRIHGDVPEGWPPLAAV